MSESQTDISTSASASAWLRSRLTTLFEDVHTPDQDRDQDQGPDAFDRAFSSTCEVRLNHAVRPLQAFKDEIVSRRAAAVRASVTWPDAQEDVVVVAAHADDEVEAKDEGAPSEVRAGAAGAAGGETPTVVAGSFVVTRSLPFRIRVTHAQRRTHVCFSAKIEQDPTVQDGGDRRRITSFYYTSVDKTPPIHFPVPRHGAAAARREAEPA